MHLLSVGRDRTSRVETAASCSEPLLCSTNASGSQLRRKVPSIWPLKVERSHNGAAATLAQGEPTNTEYLYQYLALYSTWSTFSLLLPLLLLLLVVLTLRSKCCCCC